MKTSTSSPLLDVNVLLALAWPNHQFHTSARAWFAAYGRRGWSTCAVTQLGFVRLSSNPRFTPLATTPWEALALLRQLVAVKEHRYLDASPAPVAPAFGDIAQRLIGPNQVTDAYLLVIARQHRVPLVTFDHRLKHLADSRERVVLLT